MSRLLCVAETRVQRVLSELESRGWCEWIATTSPEVDERRLFVLTDAAQKQMADLVSADTLPAGRRETLARLRRLETAVGLNRFLCQVVAAATDDVELDQADVLTLPWTTVRSCRSWPPGVEAYVCLKWHVWSQPAFIAWDRAAAPTRHRRNRVAGWYTYALSQRRQTAPILVVCPGEREAEEWAQAVVNSADRRGCPPLAVFLATTGAAQTDPLGEIWRKAHGYAEASLCDRLTRVPQENALIQSAHLPLVKLEELAVVREPLRKWATTVADHPEGASASDRVAALSLATGALQKKALEWISHHALLNSSDLSVLMNVPDRLTEKLLTGLEAHGLSQRLYRPDSEEPTPRYLLTSLGLRLLAARDGVPPRRYVRYGVIAAPDRGGASQRLDTLVSQFAHTVGTNSFFVRLARDLRIQGGMLLRWLNASESTERFTYRGELRWLRPDGYAEFKLGGRVHGFFLELDRGTARHSDRLDEKFRNYAYYFATRRETDDPADLVIVTVSPHREGAIWSSLKQVFGAPQPANVLTSVASLIDRVGPLGRAWRANGGANRRKWVTA